MKERLKDDLETYTYPLDDTWTWQTFSTAEVWEDPQGLWYGCMAKHADDPDNRQILGVIDKAEGLDSAWFGPFDTEPDAHAAGMRLWLQVKDNPAQWQTWYEEAINDDTRAWLERRFG